MSLFVLRARLGARPALTCARGASLQDLPARVLRPISAVSFYWGEGDDAHGGVPAERTVAISPFLRAMKGDEKNPPRCEALEARSACASGCGIYEQRPPPCREFEPSYEKRLAQSRVRCRTQSHRSPPRSYGPIGVAHDCLGPFACSARVPSAVRRPIRCTASVPTRPSRRPDFRALDQHGQPRTKEALLGHPTVMWFYPAAATAG
jgi:hypothetical protein